MSSPAPLPENDYPFDTQIEVILDNLDDMRIALAMEALDVRWATRDLRTGEPALAVPSRREIRAAARRLLGEAAERPDGQLQTHGFLVVKMGGRLGIYFAPVSADTFGD